MGLVNMLTFSIWNRVFLGNNFADIVSLMLIEIRIARIFNTYGPRMNIDDGRVVSNFIAQALR
jgi:hypothetical protein